MTLKLKPLTQKEIDARSKKEIEAREQRGDRSRFICFMVDALKKQHSWCAMLHIQKACYIAQEMLKVKHNYDFIRYKYGPYCFDLANDVHTASLKCLLDDIAIHKHYGKSYELSNDAQKYVDDKKLNYPHIDAVEFIANWFNDRPAIDLEEITSVYMVRNDLGTSASEDEIITATKKWKKHFSAKDIRNAIAEIDEKEKELISKNIN